MYKYTVIIILLFTAGCLHNNNNYSQTKNPEHNIRTEEQKQIQRDMRHNKCVSRGHV